MTTHPELPLGSLYVQCLGLAIQSFDDNLSMTDTQSIADRAGVFFVAAKVAST